MITSKTVRAAALAKVVPTGAPSRDWLGDTAIGMAEAYVVNVSPRMAEAWLEQNARNRRLRGAHMRTLAEEMRQGQWKLTHQGIAFGTSGRLLDGQHRLRAVVESGAPQPMLVFIDAPEDAFPNHDRGAMRGMSDILLKDAKLVSVAVTLARISLRGPFDRHRKPLPHEVGLLLETIAPDIEAMMTASVATRQGRTLSSIRGAWLVRHHLADAAGRRLLCEQWKAFADYVPKRMDESTASGDRRLENFKAIRGGAVEIESACIGWLMFDPERRELSRVLIRQSATAIDELRAGVRQIVPGLFTEVVVKTRTARGVAEAHAAA